MKPKPPTATGLRLFGLLLLAAFLLAAWYAHRHGAPPPIATALAAAGALLALVGLALPRVLVSVYSAWMALGHALGRVTTPIVLALAFALVFVPMRVLLALVGRDLLDRAFDRAAKSYWTERTRRSFTPPDFERLS